MKQTIIIPCIPPTSTSQQKGACIVGGKHIRFFKKAKVAQAENSLVSLLSTAKREQMSGASFQSGPLAVNITLVFPYLKRDKKADIAAGAHVWIDTRPDLDNLCKMLLDAMTTCAYWHDDSQVADLRLTKRRGPITGITITIENVQNISL